MKLSKSQLRLVGKTLVENMDQDREAPLFVLDEMGIELDGSELESLLVTLENLGFDQCPDCGVWKYANEECDQCFYTYDEEIEEW